MDLVDIYAFLKSNWRIIACWTVAAVAAALVYAFTATPLYTATAELALDSRKIQLFKSSDQVVGDNSLDSAQVESEVEILRSESIALAVIKDLKLTDDPDFVDTRRGLFSIIFGGPNEDVRTHIAVSALLANLSIRRVGLTHVLEISYRSPDREKAARIANEVAKAYITEQLNNKYEAARRAGIGSRSASPSCAISLVRQHGRWRTTKPRTTLSILVAGRDC